jgi:hypothetical protein
VDWNAFAARLWQNAGPDESNVNTEGKVA